MGLLEKAKERRLEYLRKKIAKTIAEKDALIIKQANVSKESLKYLNPSYQKTYKNILISIMLVNKGINKLVTEITKSKTLQIRREKIGGVAEIRGINPTLFSRYLQEKNKLINLQKQKNFIDKRMDQTYDIVKYSFALKISEKLRQIEFYTKETRNL